MRQLDLGSLIVTATISSFIEKRPPQIGAAFLLGNIVRHDALEVKARAQLRNPCRNRVVRILPKFALATLPDGC